MLMTATMTFVIGQTGIIIIGMFHPETDVGYYSVAVKLATLTAFAISAVNAMAGPKFSELYHSDKIPDLFRLAKSSAKLIFWTTSPILLALVIFGRYLLNILFGPEFTTAYPALIILVFGQFFHSISGSTALFMNMTNHHHILSRIIFLTAFINVTLNIFLTPPFSIYGASVAAMLSLFIWNGAILFYIKTKFGMTTSYFPIIAS